MNPFSMMMFNMAQKVISINALLGEDTPETPNSENQTTTATDFEQTRIGKIMKPIDDLFDVIIVPLLILIGTAGLIYSIVLGVNYSKAENPDKRDEAKKRLVNTIIGFVILLVLLVVLRLFTNNAEAIYEWITTTIDNAKANDKA